MIKLDISDLIFFYTLFSAVVILVFWIAGGYRRKRDVSSREVDYIWKCSVCSNVYVDSKYEDMSKCPLCGSYNKR
ncbi:MAG: hypothetical protein WC738_00330 [Candidatus Omnitrophota bacterium]